VDVVRTAHAQLRRLLPIKAGSKHTEVDWALAAATAGCLILAASTAVALAKCVVRAVGWSCVVVWLCLCWLSCWNCVGVITGRMFADLMDSTFHHMHARRALLVQGLTVDASTQRQEWRALHDCIAPS